MIKVITVIINVIGSIKDFIFVLFSLVINLFTLYYPMSVVFSLYKIISMYNTQQRIDKINIYTIKF